MNKCQETIRQAFVLQVRHTRYLSSPREAKGKSKLALDLLSGGMGFGVCHVMLLERMAYFVFFDSSHPATPALLS